MEKKNINDVNYNDLKKLKKIDDAKLGGILRYIEDHKVSHMNELKNVNGVNDDMINELVQNFSVGETMAEE